MSLSAPGPESLRPEAMPSRPPGRRFSVLACVGTSFTVWARNAPAFAIVSAACQAPLIAIERLAEGAFAKSEVDRFLFGILSILLSLLAWNLSLGAVTFGVLEDLRGRRATIGRCVRIALETLPRLFGISFRMALHLLVGGGPTIVLAAILCMLLPLPFSIGQPKFLAGGRDLVLAGIVGLVFLAYLARFALSGPVAVVEGLDHWESMERSHRLSFGRRLAVMATLLLVVAVPVAFCVWLRFFARGLEGASQASDPWSLIATGFEVLVVAPLLGATVATVYRDLRRDRDGIEARELALVFE